MPPLLLGITWMDPTWLLSQFGTAFFWISLVMVFVECGVLFPFLPGDTLLFAMGLFIATSDKSHFTVPLWVALPAMMIAAFVGNLAGYELGRLIGPWLYRRNGRIVKRRYLDETHAFFERHGNSALVIGRFVPFVRTYVTLVAGVTRLERARFLTWSAVGAVLWVLAVMLLGFFLGTAFPALGKDLDVAIIGLVIVSLIPIAIEWWRRSRRAKT